jgi:chloramphenicol 3-O-phosphotransferase
MLNIDPNKLQEVTQEAFDKVADSRRWQTAIAKAKSEILNNPYLHLEGDTLLILSPSNKIYSANGTCQCRAYEHGQPCWHRAAARLMKRYYETSH